MKIFYTDFVGLNALVDRGCSPLAVAKKWVGFCKKIWPLKQALSIGSLQTTLLTRKKLFANKVFVVCQLLIIAAASFAQSFTTKVSANTIGKNEYVQVDFEISNGNKVQDFRPPAFTNWEVMSGPNQSQSSFTSNGKTTSSISISYYLKPLKTGRLQIEGAAAMVDGKQMNSNTVLVNVDNKNTNTQQPATQPDPFAAMMDDPFFNQNAGNGSAQMANDFEDAEILKPGENTIKKINDNLFLRVETNKNTCYEGEPILATYKLYYRLNMTGNVSRRPSFSGFSMYDLEEPNQLPDVEIYKGKKYKVAVIKKAQLYALQTGKLTLEPTEVECNIRLAKGSLIANGSFDPYRSSSFLDTTYTCKSLATTISVLPTPEENKPSNYNGAVGNFTITALASTDMPGKGDATTLTLKIGGYGNFASVQAPSIQWPANIESYDPKETENLVKTVMPINGYKTFEYLFVANEQGVVTIPPISFSYFDAAKKKYNTVQTMPIVLRVSGQSRFPKRPEEIATTNWPLIFSNSATYVLPVLALGLIFVLLFSFVQNKKKNQNKAEQKAMVDAWERMVNDTITIETHSQYEPNNQRQLEQLYQPMPPQNINKGVGEKEDDKPAQLLPNAHLALLANEGTAFFEALKKDVLHAIATSTATAVNNKLQALLALQKKGYDAETREQIGNMIDECEAAIYSPITQTANKDLLLQEATYLLGRL